MKQLLLVILICMICSCATRSGDAPDDVFSGSVTKYQYNHVTYLIFKSSTGVSVVNYTTDSMEYELLKSSTKIKDCEDTSYTQ